MGRYSSPVMSYPLNTADIQKLNHILIEQLGIKAEQITPEANIRDDLNADSLTMIELSMAVEEQFGVTIPDDKVEQIATLGDLKQALEEILAKAVK